jgi:hypothetical protein
MSWPPMIHVVERMMPFCKFPLQIPSECEFSASCGVSECWILDLSSRGVIFDEARRLPHGKGSQYRLASPCTDGR